jgi:hypothetical protein
MLHKNIWTKAWVLVKTFLYIIIRLQIKPPSLVQWSSLERLFHGTQARASKGLVLFRVSRDEGKWPQRTGLLLCFVALGPRLCFVSELNFWQRQKFQTKAFSYNLTTLSWSNVFRPAYLYFMDCNFTGHLNFHSQLPTMPPQHPWQKVAHNMLDIYLYIYIYIYIYLWVWNRKGSAWWLRWRSLLDHHVKN